MRKIIIILFFIIISSLFTSFAFAADDVWTIFPDVQIKIPGLSFSSSVDCSDNGDGTKTCKVPFIAEYIAAIYKYAIGIVGILAVVVMMWGGVRWMTAGGNASGIGEARSWITAALTGLVLILGSYTILYFINPDLTNLKFIKIKTVKVEKAAAIASCSWQEPRVADFDPGRYCPDPLTKVDDSYCPGDKPANTEGNSDPFDLRENTEGNYLCCCNAGGVWGFDSDTIKSQISDASSDLFTLLACMRTNLPQGVGRISSISDSNYIGNVSACNTTSCPANCAHSCQSCHYGGGTNIGKSYAVDLGDEENKQIITEVVEKCDSGAYILDEGNHIHISTASCPKN